MKRRGESIRQQTDKQDAPVTPSGMPSDAHATFQRHRDQLADKQPQARYGEISSEDHTVREREKHLHLSGERTAIRGP